MREYYLDEGDLQDLKHALRTGNKKMMQQIIHSVEFRGHRLQMAQAEMILDYKWEAKL